MARARYLPAAAHRKTPQSHEKGSERHTTKGNEGFGAHLAGHEPLELFLFLEREGFQASRLSALHLVVVQALPLAVQLGTFFAPTLAVVLKRAKRFVRRKQ
jgi:hypothetical protein